MTFTYDIFETEEEAIKAKGFPMLEYGEYNFTCVEAKFKHSASGNPMISLKLSIEWDGREFFVYGNLVGTKNMAYLTKHFCEATQLENEYLKGLFNENLALNKRGRVIIGYEPERPKNDGSGEMWRAKNKVIDFVKRSEAHMNNPGPYNIPEPQSKKKPHSVPNAEETIQDDDLPF